MHPKESGQGMDTKLKQLQLALQPELASAVRYRGEIHRLWAPELSYGRHASRVKGTARNAAVLAVLYPAGEGEKDCLKWYVPAIMRPAHMGTHAGQVALPGGVQEEGESLVDCALREYSEELGGGIWPEVDIVGPLPTIFVFSSNFVITPIVALAKQRPTFVPSLDEVDQVLEVPVTLPLQTVAKGTLLLERRGLTFSAPSFLTEGIHIWGATCLILAELAACMDRAKPRLG